MLRQATVAVVAKSHSHNFLPVADASLHMQHMRKNLAFRMGETPESPFTARLKKVAEALGYFCHSEIPDDALDKRSREDAWNGKLGTKHKHVARSLYDGLWKVAGGDAVIGWSEQCMPARFTEGKTYNKRALELLGRRDSFIALAKKQFEEGSGRKLRSLPNPSTTAASGTAPNQTPRRSPPEVVEANLDQAPIGNVACPRFLIHSL